MFKILYYGGRQNGVHTYHAVTEDERAICGAKSENMVISEEPDDSFFKVNCKKCLKKQLKVEQSTQNKISN